MGTCKYCGKPAGFLRKKHRECHESFESGTKKLQTTAFNCIVGEISNSDLGPLLIEAQSKWFLSQQDSKSALTTAWEMAVDHYLDDNMIDTDEERTLIDFADKYSLDSSCLNRNGYQEKFVKSLVLRDLLDGILPQRINISGHLPFNLQKSESKVWLFNNVNYYETKTRKQYVGGSKGVSIKIAKGVYYRIGSYKGTCVSRDESVFSGSGPLLITNKNIYFSGGNKAVKIPHAKIISIDPYSDGVTIHKDGTSAKPQAFITGDGWFTHNLLSNISLL